MPAWSGSYLLIISAEGGDADRFWRWMSEFPYCHAAAEYHKREECDCESDQSLAYAFSSKIDERAGNRLVVFRCIRLVVHVTPLQRQHRCEPERILAAWLKGASSVDIVRRSTVGGT